MAQSNESNVRGIPSFWPKHTLEPPHSWTQWSDQFQLAIIEKENLDIDGLNGPEVPETKIPILDQVTGSESDTDRATSGETRNKNAMKQYEAAEEERINEEKRKFNGKSDKKLCSILFFALGSKGKRVIAQKNHRERF